VNQINSVFVEEEFWRLCCVVVYIFQLYIPIVINNRMPCEFTVICYRRCDCCFAGVRENFDRLTHVLRTSDVKFDKNLSSDTRFNPQVTNVIYIWSTHS